jgi:hypothetical protein
MFYDDGLTPEDALQIEKVRPIGFLGKDILAIQNDLRPVIKDSKVYRAELASDFRAAIEQIAEQLQHAGPERDTLKLNVPADRQISPPSIQIDR